MVGIVSQRQRRAGLLTPTEVPLLRVALELGAADSGGPLSSDEQALLDEVVDWPLVESTAANVVVTISHGGDPLGDELMRVRSPELRRSQGAFYTPPAIVEPMVAWAAGRSPARVVDAGCGSGRFALEAARQLPEAEIVAVDLDPVATLLTRANLAVAGARRAKVINGDYLTFELPAIERRTAWIGNPPYLRHHGLPTETKEWAADAAKRAGHPVSSLAGLHALFFLATALHARHGDIGSFVVSAEWLDTNYGSVIRDLLTDGLAARSFHLFDASSSVFSGVMTSAVIVNFEVGERIAEVLLERLVGAELDSAASRRSLPAAELRKAKRWSPLFRQDAALGLDGRSPSSTTDPGGGGASGVVKLATSPAKSRDLSLAGGRGGPALLGEIARVHRGQVTGANGYFSMTRRDAEELELTEWCRSAITSAEEILDSGGVVRDGPERRVVLLPPRDIDRKAHPALDRYLRRGERRRNGRPAVRAGYIASRRNPWWHVGPMKPPPIAVSYMARRPPVFALNPDRLVLLNVAHGIWPLIELDDEVLAALVTHLNAHRFSFVGQGRTYHGGLEKFEPREMEGLLVPDADRFRRLVRLAQRDLARVSLARHR